MKLTKDDICKLLSKYEIYGFKEKYDMLGRDFDEAGRSCIGKCASCEKEYLDVKYIFPIIKSEKEKRVIMFEILKGKYTGI